MYSKYVNISVCKFGKSLIGTSSGMHAFKYVSLLQARLYPCMHDLRILGYCTITININLIYSDLMCSLHVCSVSIQEFNHGIISNPQNFEETEFLLSAHTKSVHTCC